MKTLIIDAGHGGIIFGEYQTPGKRSPEFNGQVLYEGEFNRGVADELVAICVKYGVPYIYLNTNHDIPLDKRTHIINYLSPVLDCIVVSIHANAAASKEARGVEVYTSPGPTAADPLAEAWYQTYKQEFPDEKMRPDTSDGDHDKEAKFWMVVKTNPPAFLVEHPFMTNEDDCAKLADKKYRKKAAEVIFKALKPWLMPDA